MERTTQRNERCGDQSTSEPNAHQATDASPRVLAASRSGDHRPILPIVADAPCNEQRYLVARPAPLIEVHAHDDGPDWVASVPHPSSTVASSPPLPPLPPDDDNGPSLPILETPSPPIEQEVTPPSNAQTKQQVRQSLDELRALLEEGSIPPPPEPGDKANATGRARSPNPLEQQTTKSPATATPPARSRPKDRQVGRRRRPFVARFSGRRRPRRARADQPRRGPQHPPQQQREGKGLGVAARCQSADDALYRRF